jgi:hypothetical protein
MRDSWVIRLARGLAQSRHKSGEWSEREELVLGKSLSPLVVAQCFEGAVSKVWVICSARVCVWSKHKSGEWSEREEPVFGRNLDPIPVACKQGMRIGMVSSERCHPCLDDAVSNGRVIPQPIAGSVCWLKRKLGSGVRGRSWCLEEV